MGTKQTKMEGTYLPEMPIIPADKSGIPLDMAETVGYEKNLDEHDPRSPNSCRTPISIFSASYQCTGGEQNAKVNQTESAVGQLRKRFFKGFSYNLHDPRSPGCQFNRTPIYFDDSQDKVLNLDDTFADLFAETQAQATIQEQQILEQVTPKQVAVPDTEVPTEELGDVIEVNESIDCLKGNFISESHVEVSPTPSPLALTPKILQDEIDPRSPTIGVDRTPIIFNDDDDESHESVLLESILATLSLNMSDGSICSIGGTNQIINSSPYQRIESNKIDRQGQLFRKITHRRMRRARANEKIPLATRRIPKEAQMSPQRVLEDCENAVPNFSADRKLILKQKGTNDISTKRTPLSCIKNSGNLHSRSVEKSANPLQTHLEPASDDSFTNMFVKSTRDM